MTNPITTVEQARALPEIASERRIYETVSLPDGKHRRVAQMRAISNLTATPDGIVAFTDSDGRAMRVVHTVEDGWCKTPM